MKCPECQTDLPDGAKFCLECGQELNVKDQPSKSSPLPEAERKRVTALFSDLSGYTAITEKLDPEEVKEITSSIFDGIREVVDKYEGSIERFSGDGVLALFGVPKAHEDDPIRAIRAAIEIHEFVESLSPRYESKLGKALSMHSGVNTGLAVTADVNPEKGTHGVTGDSINVAARLSDLATADEILVGQDTHRATQNQFNFQPLKPAKVKGKSASIPIYKLLSEKVATAGIRQEMQVSSEMVGRDQELARLELYILKAVNGRGSVVNVFGEPGIGKSRLLAELRQRDVISRVSFLEGRSISIGKNLSFYPIIDLFKQWSKIQEDDTQAEASNKLENAIRRVCGDEADEVFPFVGTMMGMKLSGKHSQRIEGIEGEALEKLILKNVRELLIRSTELIPIVIVMEDLHWADTTSLELLESVFRLAQTHRVVFINVFRPGYWEGDDRKIETLPEWLPEADFAEIALKPLDRQKGEILVNNMLQLKGLRHAIRQQIIDRAGGNPFFIEEIVRSLIDEGAIVRINGAFEVTEKIDHVVIPSTINDVLITRIDRLEEQTRELVKVASVIGRSFFERILKDVADSIEAVDERLAYLKDVQFIRDRVRMEELEYFFKHALAQEAAYESTLIQQRKSLHQKVAQSIERVFQERLHEFYGMLAFHYSKAEELEKAEEYMLKAGDEALRSSASTEALHYYKEALRFYMTKYGDDADPERLVDFERNIALAYFNKGQLENALLFFDKVLSRWGRQPLKNRFAIYFKLGYDMLLMIYRVYMPAIRAKRVPDESQTEYFDLAWKKDIALLHLNPIRSLTEIVGEYGEVLRYDPTKMEVAVIFSMMSSSLFAFLGYFKLADSILARTRKLVEGLKGRNLIAHHFFSAWYILPSGMWADASEYDRSVVAAGERIGEIYYAGGYRVAHLYMKLYQGKFDEFEDMLGNHFNLWKNYEYDIVKAMHNLLTIEYLLIRQKGAQTQSEANNLLSFSRKRGLELHELHALGWRAAADLLMRDITSAQDSLKESEEIRDRQTFCAPWYLAGSLIAKFMLDLQLLEGAIADDSQPLVADFAKSALKSGKAAVKNSAKWAPNLTESLRFMGKYYWLVGKRRQALKWFVKSIKAGERLGARPELSRTYFEVGKCLLEPNTHQKELNGVSAKEYLKKAETMFREMDLQRDLEDLDRITS